MVSIESNFECYFVCASHLDACIWGRECERERESPFLISKWKYIPTHRRDIQAKFLIDHYVSLGWTFLLPRKSFSLHCACASVFYSIVKHKITCTHSDAMTGMTRPSSSAQQLKKNDNRKFTAFFSVSVSRSVSSVCVAVQREKRAQSEQKMIHASHRQGKKELQTPNGKRNVKTNTKDSAVSDGSAAGKWKNNISHTRGERRHGNTARQMKTTQRQRNLTICQKIQKKDCGGKRKTRKMKKKTKERSEIRRRERDDWEVGWMKDKYSKRH